MGSNVDTDRVGPALTYSWAVDQIDAGPGLSVSALATASDDTPWIAFYDGIDQDLVLAHRSPGSGCTNPAWTCEILDGAGMCGVDPCDAGDSARIAIDSLDRVHLAYWNASAVSLMYALKTGATVTKTVVFPGGGGAYPRGLALGTGDVPHVVYQTGLCCEVGVARPVLTGANCGGGFWNCSSIFGGSASGIIVEPGGRIDLAYGPPLGSGTNFAYSTSPGFGNCGQWGDFQCSDVTNGVSGGVLLNAGSPELLYFNGTTGIARYVGAGGTGCLSSTEWTCTEVDDRPAGVGSFALDSFSRAHVAFGTTDLFVASDQGGPATSPCSNTQWHCDQVAAGGGMPSIAIDSSRRMHVSHSDGGALQYAVSVEQIPEIGFAFGVVAAITLAALAAGLTALPDRGGARFRSYRAP